MVHLPTFFAVTLPFFVTVAIFLLLVDTDLIFVPFNLRVWLVFTVSESFFCLNGGRTLLDGSDLTFGGYFGNFFVGT